MNSLHGERLTVEELAPRSLYARAKANLWFFQLAIPAELQHHDKKSDGTLNKTIEKSLGTQDPAQVRLKRDAFLVEYRAQFDRLKKATATAGAGEATRWQAARLKKYQRLRRNPILARENGNPLDHALIHGPKDTESLLRTMEAYAGHSK